MSSSPVTLSVSPLQTIGLVEGLLADIWLICGSVHPPLFASTSVFLISIASIYFAEYRPFSVFLLFFPALSCINSRSAAQTVLFRYCLMTVLFLGQSFLALYPLFLQPLTYIKTHGAIFFNFSYIYFTLRNFDRNHSIFEQNCLMKVSKGDIFLNSI